jgi:hypothetical protein
MSTSNEFDGVWKEAVETYYKITSQKIIEETEDNNEKMSNNITVKFLCLLSKLWPLNFEARVASAQLRRSISLNVTVKLTLYQIKMKYKLPINVFSASTTTTSNG